MVFVEFPELAVDDVEVLVREEVCDGVDVILLVEQPQGGEEVGATQLRHAKSTAPRTVHHVKDTGYHLKKQQQYIQYLDS